MLDNLEVFFENYLILGKNSAWWIGVIAAIAHIIFMIACLGANNGDNQIKGKSTSHNTINTYLWAAVIAAFPVVGLIGYLLLSVLPYNMWKKKHGEAPFPLTCRIDKPVWILVLLALVAGAVYNKLFDSSNIKLAFVVPMLMWIAITITDFSMNYFGRYIFVALSDKENQRTDICETDNLFGVEHFEELDISKEAAIFGKDSHIARTAADEIIGNGIFTATYVSAFSDKTGIIRYIDSDKNETDKYYIYCGDDKEFKKKYSDIYDAKYIGRGVTRYIQAYWEDGETKKCVDRILYRVTPSIKNVLLRSVSVFAVIYILSSPKTAELSGKIISFICSKIGG